MARSGPLVAQTDLRLGRGASPLYTDPLASERSSPPSPPRRPWAWLVTENESQATSQTLHLEIQRWRSVPNLSLAVPNPKWSFALWSLTKKARF